MKWIISHKSALEFWRKAHAEETFARGKPRYIKPGTKPLGKLEFRVEDFQDLAIPLHVLVGSNNARKVNKNVCCHISSGEFPKGSFIQVDSGLIISSPELCFLQMAGELSFVDLVALGYEFCGNYRLDKKSAEGKGFREDIPLTSIGSLKSYIDRAVGIKGRKNAQKALRFVSDGAASPMETILAMLLILPYKLGGYGFPKPLLNYRIDLPAGVRELAGKSKYYCDLYWPDKKVDVEYDSDAHHTGPERIAQDSLRRSALMRMGITVVTATRIQVVEASKMRELAKLLSRFLKKRLQYQPKEFRRRNTKLLEQLLPKPPARS